jgi:type II restriction enzyme
MAVNLDKPHLWKLDIAQSVDMYNEWFLKFAPATFRATRVKTTEFVREALERTKYLADIGPEVLREYPQVLPTLRMSCCPPIAVDRLIGLGQVSGSLVKGMESGKGFPRNLSETILVDQLRKIGNIIQRLADPDIFVWLNRSQLPTEIEIQRAATIIADRLCGAVSNPIVRNAQELRQLEKIQSWLESREYRKIGSQDAATLTDMPPGSFTFRRNVPGMKETGKLVSIPVDVVIMPKQAKSGQLPILLEAKSAGDFANVNKRRKEEADKITNLRRKYGQAVSYNLFLCGYFDSGYLGYEAAEGIDWVWEHRIEDLAGFGL